MTNSSNIGARFESATLELFKRLFPLLGFDLIHHDLRRSGSQKGFDIFFQTRPSGTKDIHVNFFVECKGASSVKQLSLEEFEGKPGQLDNSRYNPDYWILLSPLRYLGNEFQENLQYWKRNQYPFAFITWARENKEEERAGLYLDLYKHFPDIYDVFKEDVPENIRETIPEYPLDVILEHLQSSLKNAYDEFEERVVFKGLIHGARRITPQSIYKSREPDSAKLASTRNGYYMLNARDRVVWKVVCNDFAVRNESLSVAIREAIVKVRSATTTTIWILGAPGCGKTTQMYRTAVDFALGEYPVVLINTLDLDENTQPVDYEEYFRKLHALHNAGVERADYKPLLVFIDNPAAKIEVVSKLLKRFDDDDEKFKCIFLLFEREVRYRQAEEESFLLDFDIDDTHKIYIDNLDTGFKETVFQEFADALKLSPSDHDLAKGAFLDSPEVSVAEAAINFFKKTNNTEYKRRLFVMDWQDFHEIVKDPNLNIESLSDTYKWVSVLYQFGIAMPTSLLAKLLPDFNENEFHNFEDFFNKEEYENLPIILEGNTLRARHELVAQWHVEEKLSSSIRQRLNNLLRVVDNDNALERSVFTSLLGRKNIVRRYFTGLSKPDLENLQQKAASHSLSHRIVMMTIGWIQYFKREYIPARDTFKAVMDKYRTFLPAILETGKTEFLLGNVSEAEHILEHLLALEPNDLHARTELAKIYQAQKRYDEAEKILKVLLELEPESLQARTELARVYQAQKRYVEAEEILRKLLSVDPESLQARTELAKIYQAQKRYDEAESVLEELLKLEPQSLQARTELARVYQAQKRYDEAEIVLNQCLAISSDDLNSRTELAKIYRVQNKFKKAAEVLKECIKLSPDDLNSRTELAKVYQAQKRYVEAEEILRKLLSVDPESLQARTELAKIYQAQKRYDEAEKILKEALEIDDKQLHSRTELARVYQAQKRYDEAEKILKEALEIDDKQLHPRTELAKVYQAQKRYVEAEEILRKLLSVDPESLQARTELAKVYQAQKRYDEAEKILKEALEIDDKQLHSRTELARVYQAQKRYDEAEIVLKEELELAPSALQPRTELAKVYQAQKRYDEAEKILKEALEIDDKQLHPRTELAKVYQAQKRYVEAEEILRKLLSVDPESLQARTELAKIYQAQKRYDEAESVLEELLKLEPQSLQARTELARVYQAQKRYDEAEIVLKEELELAPSALQPRTELARVYIKQGLFRRARAEVLDFLRENPDADPERIAHLILTYLNACYLMRRYQDGTNLVDKFGCHFVSPQLAEEYGRLLRSYDLSNTVVFFQTASRIFSNADRLLSEAAVCSKLAGRLDARDILENAIRLEPKREAKYRSIFDNVRPATEIKFKDKDCAGFINDIDYPQMRGIIRARDRNYSFRSNIYTELLFNKLKINDEVLFDITSGNYAINVEPSF